MMAFLTATDMPSLLDAIDRAAQEPGTDWTIWCDSGVYGSPAGETTVTRKVFDGTVTDHNAARPFDQYLAGSRATVTGGSVTIRARTPLGVRITDRIEVVGSGPFLWNGIDFQAQTDSDNGSAAKGTSFTWWQLKHSFNRTHPAQKPSIVRACRFGGTAAKAPPSRWMMGCDMTAGSVIEDCRFDGFTRGAVADVIRRCSFRRQAADSIRIGFGSGPHTPASVYACTIWDRSTAPEWVGQHTDAMQFGSVDTDHPVSVFLWDNVIHGEVPMHGIYMDDTSSTIGGWIRDNLIVTAHLHGIAIWRGEGLAITGNTVVRVPNGPPANRSAATPQIRSAGNSVPGAVTLRDNIATALPFADPDLVDGGGNVAIAATGDAYGRVFAGPFSGGSGWPVGAIDTTDAPRLRASVKALFERR